MEHLPDSLLVDIIERITSTSDRNSLSLVSKRLYIIDAHYRKTLRIGCGLHPATEAFISLCTRFPNLANVEIVYSGWTSNMGKQLDNEGLHVLASHCPSLMTLNLSFCSFINDSGLHYLASCKNLKALELNFAPAIHASGLLSVVIGCKNLSTLRLIRCMNVNSIDWFEYLGRLDNLEELAIRNCRGISVEGLSKLGPGWQKLRRLEFELDNGYRPYKSSLGFPRQDYIICCPKLKELSLINCIIEPGMVLAKLFGCCSGLEKLRLEMCVGVKDSDVVMLSQTSCNLSSIDIRLASQWVTHALVNQPLELTDVSLNSLACGCRLLQELYLSFSDGEFPTLSGFTQAGVLILMQSCPVRVLRLDSAYFFNDEGMEALCSAPFLDTLELVKCHEVSDAGLQFVTQLRRLRTLGLIRCLNVTNNGLRPLLDSQKLDSLIIVGCPKIFQDGLQGGAKRITYNEDLSWLH